MTAKLQLVILHRLRVLSESSAFGEADNIAFDYIDEFGTSLCTKETWPGLLNQVDVVDKEIERVKITVVSPEEYDFDMQVNNSHLMNFKTSARHLIFDARESDLTDAEILDIFMKKIKREM